VLVVGCDAQGLPLQTPAITTEAPMPKIGRNAGTGQFTTVKTAKDHPKTHVVETIKPTKKK
jgi:hypothetical protein